MRQNKCEQSSGQSGIVKRALIMLVALSVVPLAFGTPENEKNKDVACTRVYQHTFDEVFQAIQEKSERDGGFVTDKDKEKGTITEEIANGKETYYFHVEPLNNKPETLVTVVQKWRGYHAPFAKAYRSCDGLQQYYFRDLQKVLSTYR